MSKKIKGFLIIILCIIFFSSILLLLQAVMGYRATDKLYADSAAKFTAAAEGGSASEQSSGQDDDIAPITVDFAALQSVNEDVVGWIYCEGTDINYPVLQGEDNDYYLHHTYNREENRAGSIFVEALNTPGFADSNTIIYGHHMKNGSMFATLRNWADQTYYEEHPVFWLLTPEQDYRIVLFSGYTTAAVSDTYTIYQGPCQEFDDYVQAALASSDFKADITPESGDRCVLLSTCEYDFQDARYVLHGVLKPCKKN